MLLPYLDFKHLNFAFKFYKLILFLDLQVWKYKQTFFPKNQNFLKVYSCFWPFFYIISYKSYFLRYYSLKTDFKMLLFNIISLNLVNILGTNSDCNSRIKS